MLDRIVAEAGERGDRLAESEDRLREAAAQAPPARDFAGSLRVPGLSVIAEVKRRSPSAGPIAPELDVEAVATTYLLGGAAALSVLTEPAHFGALPNDLGDARRVSGLPVLRKDFIVHTAQVWESRAMEADAILLIVAALEQGTLERLLACAHEAGLAALVEVHTASEAKRAVDGGASIIGVNNRDLRTFEVDLETAERLAGAVAAAAVAVAESGVSTPGAAARMAAAGYDAVLVGEAAVRSPDPAAFVAALREAG
jgi:indole-3-glycerol phosphate synthase